LFFKRFDGQVWVHNQTPLEAHAVYKEIADLQAFLGDLIDFWIKCAIIAKVVKENILEAGGPYALFSLFHFCVACSQHSFSPYRAG